MEDLGNNLENMQMPQLNLKEYETIQCDKCGNVAFTPAMILKVVPGIVIGTGSQNKILPDNILVCSKCGTIFKRDREYYDLDEDGKPNKKEEKPVENKSSIII